MRQPWLRGLMGALGAYLQRWWGGERRRDRALACQHRVMETPPPACGDDRRAYIARARVAMRALIDSVLPGGRVLADTETAYRKRSECGGLELSWLDGGVSRYWNLFAHRRGSAGGRWAMSVIDADEPLRTRFEICYDETVRTGDVERVVRSHPGGAGLRVYTGRDEDVGQQTGLTLPMLRDALRLLLA